MHQSEKIKRHKAGWRPGNDARIPSNDLSNYFMQYMWLPVLLEDLPAFTGYNHIFFATKHRHGAHHML